MSRRLKSTGEDRCRLVSHFDEGEFTQAGTALHVSDGDLPIVFNPPLSAQDVVYARGHLVPFVVISKPTD